MATVNLTWSTSNGGTAISGNLDHGNASNGVATTAQEVFIRHDGTNSITSCGIYIREFSGTYSGGASAALDLAELLGWGDNSTESTYGGFEINMNATGSYPAAAWPVYNSKSPSQGHVFRTGTGDSQANAITISTATGATASGEIQSGSSPNVRFQCRISVPSAEDTIGIRQFDTVLVYVYTS